MTPTKLLALATAAGLAAAPLGAATPAAAAPTHYDVQLVMRDGDAAPTRPRLTVEAGRAATFMVANPRYSMRMVATPEAGGRVSLASEIASWTPEGLHVDASTVTLDADGAPSTIVFPHADPATGVTRRMRVDVSVRPVDQAPSP